MFFVFHILVFAYLTSSEINCYSRGTVSEGGSYGGKHEHIPNSKGVDVSEIPEITNKINADLRSNIFDQILTDEMLSVKGHHDHEDNSVISLSPTSTKSPFMTPTLEMNQKWPMFKNLNSNLKDFKNIGEESGSGLVADYKKNNTRTPQLKLQNPIQSKLVNNKVVELRSLPTKLNSAAKSSPKGKLCTCMKSNPSTCVHSCTGTSNKKRCTHSTPSSKTHECSRSTSPNQTCTHTPSTLQITTPEYLYPPFYIPYDTYFKSVPPDFPYTVTYPHPFVLSDSKVPHKRKHHKKTTLADDDLYYDESDNQGRISYIDESNEAYVDKERPRKNKPPKTNKEHLVHLSINYEENTDKPDKTKLSNKKSYNKIGSIYDISQDQLIKEIVSDLKNHESSIINDCYCNSSPRLFKTDIFVVLLLLLYKFSM